MTWPWLAGSPVTGELAQLVERPLCMWEVPGSMPGFSKSSLIFLSSRYSLEKDPILGIACWLVGHILLGAVAQLVKAPVFFVLCEGACSPVTIYINAIVFMFYQGECNRNELVKDL